MLQDKTPAQLEREPIRILEPACGNGAFLLGAYQYLLDWHYNWRITHDPAVSKNWKLTYAERRRILLNSIYGVDFDSQALESAKQALVLKLLETEAQLPQTQWEWFTTSTLVELGHNLKCGNSIISPDFDAIRQVHDLDLNSDKVKAFDWHLEFPTIMQNGGFDTVIGNPPYLDAEIMTEHWSAWRHYCASHYRTASGNWDLFCIFIEQAIALCKPEGFTSLIVPNKLASAGYAAVARQILAIENCLLTVRDYSAIPVFPVAVYPIVYAAQKKLPSPEALVRYERMQLSTDAEAECVTQWELDYRCHFMQPKQPWPAFISSEASNLVARLRSQFPTLGSIAQVMGAATVAEAYKIQSLIQEDSQQNTAGLKVVNSGTIDRYRVMWGKKQMRYLGASYLCPMIPLAQTHQLPQKRQHQATQPKIIVAGMTRELECIVDLEGTILAGKSTSIVLSSLNLRYLLALLNCKLITFYYQSLFGGDRLQGGYLRIGPPQLRMLPIPIPNLTQAADQVHYQQIIRLVEDLLKQQLLQQSTTRLDQAIDQQVYELYQLRPEEIAIVEQHQA